MCPPHTLPNPPDATTTAVLRMAVVRHQAAIDRLLDLLASESPDGADLFTRLLESPPLPDDLPSPRSVADDTPALPELERLKRHAKVMTANATGELDRMRGTALYTLAVAGALAHHARRISSAAPTELRQILLEFAELTSAPWSAIFARAAAAFTEGADAHDRA